MRRIIIIGTALAALVFAAAAYAFVNSYAGTAMKFSPNKTGSKKKPAALGWTQTLAAANNTSGDRAAPLIDIKTLMYGIKVDQKDFAKCSATEQISLCRCEFWSAK